MNVRPFAPASACDVRAQRAATPETDRVIHAVGLLVALLAGLALFWATRTWPDTPDGWIHLHRVRALTDSLRAGVFYPRWFPDFAFGYGYPVLNFYAPAFYYPPALLHLAGVDIFVAVRLTLALVYGLSAWAMIALLRPLLAWPATLAATVVFLAFPYRLVDLFVRGALPEFAAFLWLPLVAWGLTALLRNLATQTSWRPKLRLSAPAFVFAALAVAGLVLTHNLSALMIGVAAVAVVPLLAFAPGARRRVGAGALAVVLAFGLGALLAAWYIVPALVEARWVGIGSTPPAYGFANHFVDWRNAVNWGLPYRYPAAADPTVPLPGYAVLALLFGVAALWVTHRPQTRAVLAAGLVLTLLSVWLTTSYSAWLWHLAAPVLGKLQFPWRWQTVTAFGVALLVGGVLQALADRICRPRPVWIAAGATALLILVISTDGLNYAPSPLTSADITVAQMWATDAAYGQVGATWTGEFLPIWVTEERWAIGREPTQPYAPAAPVDLVARPNWPAAQRFNFETVSDDAASLILTQFYYPAWRARVDGTTMDLTPHGDLGLARLDLSPGGHVSNIVWSATPAVRWGRGLATLGWLLVCGLLLARRRLWPLLLLWLAAGSVALVGMSGYTEVRTPLTWIGGDAGANFGPVRLEAAAVPATQAGATAPVTLYWTVQSQTDDLNAFFHVVDAAGAVVAQHDGPLAGDYMPAARWEPGLTLARTHPVALPPDLPPGEYTVMAGVYLPGQPAAPLRVDGDAGPRILVATLQVTP